MSHALLDKYLDDDVGNTSSFSLDTFEYILKSLYTNIDGNKDNDDQGDGQGGGTNLATSSTVSSGKRRLDDSTHTYR